MIGYQPAISGFALLVLIYRQRLCDLWDCEIQTITSNKSLYCETLQGGIPFLTTRLKNIGLFRILFVFLRSCIERFTLRPSS